MIRPAFLPTLPASFGASAVLHLGLVAIVVGHRFAAPMASVEQPESRIEIEAVLADDVQIADDAAKAPLRPAVRANHFPKHHHPYRVPADHDARPHDPDMVHTSGAPAAVTESGATLAEAPAAVESAPPRFALALSTIGARSSNVPPHYPLAARQAELEADVSVEIVVDTTGRVIAAKAVTSNGYGLDEEAVRAVRSFRFSPAVRSERPVAVRMRWIVQFRLQ